MRNLDEGFAYDAWANELWAPVLARQPDSDLASVAAHIAKASNIWLTRVNAALGTEHADWHEVVSSADDTQDIAYLNLAGQPFQNTLGEIAWHVLNHSTYHRGQMRQLAEAAGIDFPETDLIRFYRELA